MCSGITPWSSGLVMVASSLAPVHTYLDCCHRWLATANPLLCLGTATQQNVQIGTIDLPPTFLSPVQEKHRGEESPLSQGCVVHPLTARS